MKSSRTEFRAVGRQVEWKSFIELAPLGKWGTFIPRSDLEADLHLTFQGIIDRYYSELKFGDRQNTGVVRTVTIGTTTINLAYMKVL